jgi:hypothetical protein
MSHRNSPDAALLRATLAAALAASLGTGCASFTSMQTASVVPEGKVRGFVAPETVGIVTSDSSSGSSSTFVPQLEAGVRVGLGHGWDIGAKAWLLGFAVDGKFELLNAGGNILSVGPGVGYFGANSSTTGSSDSLNIITFYLPLYYGLKLGEHELVISPKAIDQLVLGNGTDSSGKTSSSGNLLWLGGSVGIALKVGQSFRLVPEISVMYPAAISGTSVSATGSSSSGTVSGGALMVQGGVGFLFGD